MSDYSSILETVPRKDLQTLNRFLNNKPYLEMFCKAIIHNKSHTVHFDTWQIELNSLTDIDTLIEQLAKIL